MNRPIFLATLGQRPQAITLALDILLPRYHYEMIGVLHTDPNHSDVATSYQELMQVLRQDYPQCYIQNHEMVQLDGDPLLDITDEYSAEGYFHSLLKVLRASRIQGIPIHLLIAGGRKAMSIYAVIAASYVFGSEDRVWTILSDHHVLAEGAFHVPKSATVQVVHLPIKPSRLLPGILADQPLEALLQTPTSPREAFLKELTPEERALVEMLSEHPYVENQQLAELLHKSLKTVEHQLGSTYRKLETYFDLKVNVKRKRQVLLDVLQGRV